MHLLRHLSRSLAALITRAKTIDILLLVFGYAACGWLLLVLAGEQSIADLSIYPYWLVVTASTVGYGDYSPETPAGRLITLVFIIPLGLSLFAMLVGRVGFAISKYFQDHIRGFGMTNHKNHVAILGWNGHRTHKLIELLQHSSENQNIPIELYVARDMENPFSERIDMIRVQSFADEEGFARGSLKNATTIIIDTEQDDVTVTAALCCGKLVPNAHVTAYFKDESVARLIIDHIPQLEVVPDVSVEMLAKASLDRGSSRVHKELLDTSTGHTQYSFTLATPPQQLTYLQLVTTLLTGHQATVLGFISARTGAIQLNAKHDQLLAAGDTIFYVADNRIDSAILNASISGAAHA